ncbi:hypothetical protein [Streptomyces sp. NPDC051561]|uniref:hypothetical protein n=1 Tax=Streptomyces sp. NPDC051561 TaxID=3365658 RepID=UPI003794FBE4
MRSVRSVRLAVAALALLVATPFLVTHSGQAPSKDLRRYGLPTLAALGNLWKPSDPSLPTKEYVTEVPQSLSAECYRDESTLRDWRLRVESDEIRPAAYANFLTDSNLQLSIQVAHLPDAEINRLTRAMVDAPLTCSGLEIPVLRENGENPVLTVATQSLPLPPELGDRSIGLHRARIPELFAADLLSSDEALYLLREGNYVALVSLSGWDLSQASYGPDSPPAKRVLTRTAERLRTLNSQNSS